MIAAVALLVLGPEKFPKYAKMAARFIRDIKAYANEVQTEIGKEIKPLTKELGDLRRIDPAKYLDKLIAEDAADTRPMNPEPHPSEVDLGAPVPGAPAPFETPPATPSDAVSYGSAAGSYPEETDVPATPPPVTAPGPERLDG